MELYEEIELQECPICGGPAALEEENDWSFYVACLDCGAHTADLRYASGDTRRDAAQRAADLLGERLQMADVNVVNGGQPVYYYMISFE